MNVLAIIIGNNDYPDPDKLTNAIADAMAMCDVFQRLGYKTIAFYNYHKEDIPHILQTIEKELPRYDASIFYYAGHGFQVDGENYLPSVGCQISYAGKHQLRYESILLSELLDLYRQHTKKTNIVILDACRVRPANRGAADSFSPIEAPQGTLIAFSTSPNSPAKDGGPDGHSLYTAALLSYIGRERMTVEQLFKKVRRTVVQWSNNTQIPWEHTSLIGEFVFNMGQLVVSPQLPYNERVVKDAEYKADDEVGGLIEEIRSCDYNRQNPAIEKLWNKKTADLDKNQQFIFGRNLLQSSSISFSAQRFMNSLADNLKKYQTKEQDNHVLNGILFEIFFDSHGEFRANGLKRHYYEEVMALRRFPVFASSFNFIRTALTPYKENFFYLISDEGDEKIDADITVCKDKVNNYFGEEEIVSIITNVSVNGIDITNRVKERYYNSGISLKDAIAIVTMAPIDVVSLHTNLPLDGKIVFE